MLHGRFALLGALALFLLTNMSSAQSFWCISTAQTSSLTDSAINSCILGTAVPYVAIALLLSFALVAVTYMLGEIFGISALKSWYKLEMWEITKTLLVVIIVFSAIIIVGAFAASINGQSVTNYNLGTLYSTADNYMTYQYDIAANAFDNMLGISLGINYLSSIKLDDYAYWKIYIIQYIDTTSVPPAPATTGPVLIPGGFAVAPLTVPTGLTCPYYLPDLATIGGQLYTGPVTSCEYLGTVNFGSDQYIYQSELLSTDVVEGKGFGVNTITMLVIPVFLILGVESVVLPLLAYAGLGVFLPLGIILRAIPFLRGVGGTLIALGFAFALIYPSAIIALNIPVTNIFQLNSIGQFYPYTPPSQFFCATLNGASAFVGSICDLVTQEINSVGFITPLELQFGGPTGPLANGYETGLNGAFMGIIPALNSSLTYTIPLVVQFLLFVLDLIVIYALTNNIAKMLGGSIKLGIGKMKLV